MRIYFLLFIVAISSISYAQNTTECSRALTSAEEAFEQGRLLFILDKNENRAFYKCLEEGGFTWEEEVRAHKLLTKTFHFTDNELDAESSFVNLLKTDKEHILSADDPAELYYLYSKFLTEPIFRVSLKGGVNKSLPKVMQSFSDKLYNQNGENVGLGINFFGELLIERHFGKIAKGLEMGLGATWWGLTYGVEGAFAENDLSYEARVRSSYLRVPVLAKYNFNYDQKNNEGQRKKLMPYVFAGASYDLLLSSIYQDTRRQGGEAFVLPDDEENASLDFRDQVNSSNVSFFLGVGTKMRIGRSNVDFITYEFRFENMLFNHLNTDNRFANPVVSQNIHLIEDDLTINAVSFSIGYTRSFYKPRKQKAYR